MRIKLGLNIVLLAALGVSPCLAWGPDGHRIVGDIATKHLNAKAQAAVKDLLGEESLADAGNWADEIRKNPTYDWVKPLHYINVPRDAKKVDLQRDCKEEKCVVAAIEKYAAVLKDKDAAKEDKVQALKLLVHFVGDVHQPLHVSYADDRGGNSVKVSFLGKPDWNLHSIWDSALIEHDMKGDRAAMTKRLEEANTPARIKRWTASVDPVKWADESLAITRELYKDVPADGAIDEAYCKRHVDTVEERLSAAGVRLAAMCNAIWPEPEVKKEPPATHPAE